MKVNKKEHNASITGTTNNLVHEGQALLKLAAHLNAVGLLAASEEIEMRVSRMLANVRGLSERARRG